MCLYIGIRTLQMNKADKPSMNYGRAVRVLCAIYNVSHKKLADHIGASPSYLSSVATGRREPGLKFLGRIAEAFGAPMSVFMLLATDGNVTDDVTAEEAGKIFARLLAGAVPAPINAEQ